jgi:peroxiredoxin-like protein
VGNLESPVSIPKELNGPGIGTNPEELIVGAAATCYLITLAAILERRKLKVTQLELSSVVTMTAEGAHKLTGLVHRPRIRLSVDSTDQDLATARDATERAEKACMVSNAVRGNLPITVEADIQKA